MPVEPVPERIIGVQVPGDCLGICKRRLLALVVVAGLLEVQQVLDVIFHDGAASGSLDRALIAAVFTLNGARYVEPAQLLDGVIAHAVLEDVAPGVGKGPEAFGNVRTNRGAFRPGRTFPLAAFHLRAHLRIHLLQRNVADSLPCHGMSSPTAFGRSLKSGVSKSASSGTGWQDRRKPDSTDLRP